MKHLFEGTAHRSGIWREGFGPNKQKIFNNKQHSREKEEHPRAWGWLLLEASEVCPDVSSLFKRVLVLPSLVFQGSCTVQSWLGPRRVLAVPAVLLQLGPATLSETC